MAYSKNPYLPKLRQKAVNLVYQGWTQRQTERYFGLSPGTVSKWIQKDPWRGLRPLETLSSAPASHPNELPQELVDAICAKRKKRGRCAEVVHAELVKEGVFVSLSSVQRTLDRKGLTKKRSPWKRWHFSDPRPFALNPGDLVELDTVHIAPRRFQDFSKFYVYTLLDVFSRWAWARVFARINTHSSLLFVQDAQRKAPFSFSHLQSDHGSEFSTWFTENISLPHRHSRVRKPNDNGHVERFNRTLQEECLRGIPCNPGDYQKAISRYLPYYNNRRSHMALEFKTPAQCCQGAD